MAEDQPEPVGPDLAQGIALAQLPDGGKLVGHVGGDEVLLVRRGTEIFAVAAHCTHYHGPLADGLVVGDTVRCPWHHACFDLRSGEALHAPALSPIACWSVEQRDGKIFVREKRAEPEPKVRAAPPGAMPEKIVIVGGGAAGFAAAERLRRAQYRGSIVMLSDDDAPPSIGQTFPRTTSQAPRRRIGCRCVPTASIPRTPSICASRHMSPGIDPRAREVALADGSKLPFDRLLLATGAEPVRLSIPGADQPHVSTLRSLADCRAIIARAVTARRAVVLGASFIGLECAAALRTRNIEVHVVAPEKRPMERILGPQMGDFIRALHEEHGVIFHLEDTASAIDGNGSSSRAAPSSEADLVIVGVGVRPRTQLAEAAGLSVDRGVVVNAYLETSAPGIFAAGDIARWPDPHSGERIRVEHWVVAERQGTNRGAQHARAPREIHRRSLLLEPALRHSDQLCRPCGEMGRTRDRGRYPGQGLHPALQSQWPHARRGFDLS